MLLVVLPLIGLAESLSWTGGGHRRPVPVELGNRAIANSKRLAMIFYRPWHFTTTALLLQETNCFHSLRQQLDFSSFALVQDSNSSAVAAPSLPENFLVRTK